jgi:sulfur carrier protein ThiS
VSQPGQAVIRVHLGGHLSWYDSEKRAWLDLPAGGPVALADLAARFGIPAAEIAIISLNRRAVELNGPTARPGDVVEFFPPIGGG